MAVDTSARVGAVTLGHPLMTAAGTSGHGSELADFGDLSSLGAVVVKSLAAFEWQGNPAPRLHPLPGGMLNAVGLQGPGVAAWAEHSYPSLAASGATIVVSIWGRTIDEYAAAVDALSDVLDRCDAQGRVVAVEVNLSCPNLAGHGIFAHDEAVSCRVIERCAPLKRPVWAKLSPNTDKVVEIAGAVRDAGADAVTLINTVTGLVLDEKTGMSVLGHGAGGGLSGGIVHPIAVRAVYDVRAAHPDLPIIGVGGISCAWDAVELMIAGADAVQVGTATFADPRAPFRLRASLTQWARDHGFTRLRDLVGLAHRGGFHRQAQGRASDRRANVVSAGSHDERRTHEDD